MKSPFYKFLNLTAFLFFISNIVVSAQVTSTSSDGRNDTKPAQVAIAEARINQVTQESGRYFKQGLLSLQDNRRADTGEQFNKAVESFLVSGINLTSKDNAKARDCYNQLVETIYRVEFPSDAQLPQIRSLSATCGWNIENQLADDVTKLVRPSINNPAGKLSNGNSTVATNGDETPAVDPQVGFNEQKFEASPLDDLAKLELTPEEQQVDSNPVAQQQYQYIQYAVANKSLGFSFQVDPRIQQFINYYRGRGRATMETGLYRSGMFMRMARRVFKDEGVPENVAWLAQVESAWKPTAMSGAAASGLWQFIPGTGQRFGLRRTAYIDERNSFEGATRASARYLKFLANRYGGNWELAMAAYNSGEGNVDRAIRRAGVSNFWVAYPYLPQETRNYVPNILATILIANSPQQYGFGHIRPAPSLIYDQIRVPASTNLGLIAQASDTNVLYLRYLNPELRSNVTPPEPYVVRVPAGKANEVVALFRRIPVVERNNANLARSVNGETWQSISNRTGVGIEQLMAANPGMKVPVGKVFVPVAGNNLKTIAYSRPSNLPAIPQSNVRVVKAQAGDTVATIARRYGVNATEVAKFNGLLPTSILGAGREIKLPN